jgi:hypothetical protein
MIINAILRYRSIGVVAAAAALLAGACSNRSEPRGETATYRTHDGRVVRYAVAPEAKLLDVAVTATGGRTIIRLTTGATMSPFGGPLAFDVHFSDHREVAFVRNFTYPCPGRFERAAVLDARTGAVLGNVEVTVDTNRLELSFDSALVRGRPRVAVSRYLPTAAALREALGGLENAYITMRTFGPEGTMYSAVPFSGAARISNLSDLSDTSDLLDLSAERRTRFGPPPGTTNFEPTTPLIQIPSGNASIEVVDHESNWPSEGDFHTGFEDDCDDQILCGWFTWRAKVSFIGGCGADLDGDGHLGGHEIRWYFGFCAFPSAVNDTWQDTRGYVHWENFGRDKHAGRIYSYSMHPTTGQLAVRHSEDSGQTWESVYQGPGRGGPEGWKLFPAPPPAPPTCTVAGLRSPRTDPTSMLYAAEVAVAGPF